MKLVMIPFAGGSASSYEPIAREIELKSELNCILYEYQGHGQRITEDLLNDETMVIEDCCKFIEKNNPENEELVVFGHSLGALVAYKVTKELISRGHNIVGLVVSGMAPPNYKESNEHKFRSNESFLIDISTLGGIPSEIMNNSEAVDFFGEILKNDYQLYDNLTDQVTQINLPILALWGDADENFSESIVKKWEKVTKLNFQIREYQGNHFFILENTSLVADELIKFSESLIKKQQLIINFFYDQVRKTPKKNAVITENKRYSYKQIDSLSNIVAKELLENGVKAGDFVPLIMQRSEKLICAILGILKVGAVYVPISPDFPDERKEFILRDTASKVLLVDKANSVNDFKIKNICVCSLMFDKDIEREIPKLELLENSPLYCIYTSGTTGNPKGVINTNAGCINRITWMQDEYPISSGDKILQKTNYVFDVSVWELFWWFFVGASCVLLEDGQQGNPENIYETVISNQITVIHFVPTMLSMYLNYLKQNDIQDTSKIKWVFSSGESLKPKYGSEFYQYCNGTLINLYGPTEASIDVTHYRVSGKEKKMPIGKSITNMQVIVATPDSFEQCAENQEGEIFITGIGVAKGYLNNIKKTTEAFITNPFGKGTCYRTGDYGYIENGLLYYLGRKDNQIKMNGFRIELDEISTKINEIHPIEDSRVLSVTRGARTVIQAYIISNRKVEETNIREKLSNKLPEYMVPHEYYFVKEFPTTINGKLDSNTLIAISNDIINMEFKPVEMNSKEKKINECLENVLGKKNLDQDKSFISLGGDSITAIRLLSNLRTNGFDCSLKDILTSSTIYDLCQLVEVEHKKFHNEYSSFGLIQDTPILKLFKNYDLKYPGHFNQIRSKNENDLTIEQIANVFDFLIKVHPEMAAVITDSHGLFVEDKPFSNIKVIKREEQMEIDWAMEIETLYRNNELNFRISDPLFKVIIYQLGSESEKKLLLIAHHLIIDEISWKNIFSDYDNVKKDILLGINSNQFELEKTSFRAWSYLINDYKKKFKDTEEAFFWRHKHEKFKKWNEIINQNFENTSSEIVSISSFLMTKEELEETVNDKYFSSFDIILNAVRQALFNCMDTLSTLPLFVESHGRSEFSERVRIDRTVGWFTSCYPMILERIEDDRESLFDTHQEIKNIPNEGIGYGLIMDEFDYNPPHFLFNFFGIIEEDNEIQKIDNFYHYEKNRENYLSMHPMKIDVMIVDSKVRITIEAQKKYYSQSFINNLFKEIQINLETSIQEDNTSLDFEIDSEIGYGDLANILEKLN